MKRTMDMASQTGKGARHAALFLGLAMAIGGCVDEGSVDPRPGNSCKSTRGDVLGGGGTDAALDEGAGLVSYRSYWFVDTIGSGAELNLVTCETGRQVTIGRNDYFDAEHQHLNGAAATSAEWAAIKSSDDFFTRLRKAVDIKDENALRPLQRRYGFELETQQASADSDMAICACKLYYPKATGDWATTKMTDAAASN